MDNEAKAMSTKELTQAVHLLLEREEARDLQQRRKRRRRLRDRREEMQASMDKLAHSIEVIKWCIVGIATSIVIALLVLILVVMGIQNEAERIKGEVQQIRGEAETIVREIEREANAIRDKLQNPMRSLGGALGSELDKKISDAMGLDD